MDLVFQDDLIKCKQNFDVIMDDTFIHLTAEEHMNDFNGSFQGTIQIWSKNINTQMSIFKEKYSIYGIRVSG